MEAVQTEFRAVEETYGTNVLQLVVTSGYLGRLIGNEPIKGYLDENHPEFVPQFLSIVRAVSLDQGQ